MELTHQTEPPLKAKQDGFLKKLKLLQNKKPEIKRIFERNVTSFIAKINLH